jgi:predicted dehydrogenase
MSLVPYKVALIGAGAISYTYLDNMCNRFDILDVVGCSDIIPERSKARAEEFGIRQMTNEEILADPEISIVVNTTYPKSHYPVTKAALEAGKHVHSEKMLATTFEDAKELAALAASKGLRLGAAPDTFLGGGYQTVRKLVDDGFIGIPLHVNALVMRGYHYAMPMSREPGRSCSTPAAPFPSIWAATTSTPWWPCSVPSSASPASPAPTRAKSTRTPCTPSMASR